MSSELAGLALLAGVPVLTLAHIASARQKEQHAREVARMEMEAERLNQIAAQKQEERMAGVIDGFKTASPQQFARQQPSLVAILKELQRRQAAPELSIGHNAGGLAGDDITTADLGMQDFEEQAEAVLRKRAMVGAFLPGDQNVTNQERKLGSLPPGYVLSHRQDGDNRIIDIHDAKEKNVGYLRHHPGAGDEGHEWIDSLYVAPKHRGKGLSRTLMEEVITRNESKELRLRARPHKDKAVDAEGLKKMYRKHGFRDLDDENRMVRERQEKLASAMNHFADFEEQAEAVLRKRAMVGALVPLLMCKSAAAPVEAVASALGGPSLRGKYLLPALGVGATAALLGHPLLEQASITKEALGTSIIDSAIGVGKGVVKGGIGAGKFAIRNPRTALAMGVGGAALGYGAYKGTQAAGKATSGFGDWMRQGPKKTNSWALGQPPAAYTNEYGVAIYD